MNSIALENCKILKYGEFAEENILIENGVIKDISPKNIAAKKIIDCRGLFLMPGIIDCHVHFRTPGMEEKEDWNTASHASAAGGVTTVLDMPNTLPPTTTISALEGKRKIAQKNSLVNFGFHFGATGGNIAEIGRAQGIGSIKIFTGKSTGSLFLEDSEKIKKVFEVAKKRDFVVCIHAEDQKIILKNEKKFAGKSHPLLHSEIRTAEAESSAIEMVLEIQKKTGNRLHICHLSSKEGVQVLREAKEARAGISCEVAPHHLFLKENDLRALGNFGKVNPSIKGEKDRTALWAGLKDGTIDCIASDHAPHLVSEKKLDYWSAPSGMPGVETLGPLMLDAVLSKKISFEKFLDLACRNPAKIFGIKSKGGLKIGFDADLALFDLEKTHTINSEKLFTKCGWSAFDSLKLKGALAKTIIAGEIVFEDGAFNESFRGKEVF